jgi:hypothetical protein
MKVKVKYRHIEIEVSDNGTQDKSLLYHNEGYSFKILEDLVNKVKDIAKLDNEIYLSNKFDE